VVAMSSAETPSCGVRRGACRGASSRRRGGRRPCSAGAHPAGAHGGVQGVHPGSRCAAGWQRGSGHRHGRAGGGHVRAASVGAAEGDAAVRMSTAPGRLQDMLGSAQRRLAKAHSARPRTGVQPEARKQQGAVRACHQDQGESASMMPRGPPKPAAAPRAPPKGKRRRPTRVLPDQLSSFGRRMQASPSAAAASDASPPPLVRSPATLELQHRGYVLLKKVLTGARCRVLRSAAARENYSPSHDSGPIFNGTSAGQRFHARGESWAPGAERDLEILFMHAGVMIVFMHAGILFPND